MNKPLILIVEDDPPIRNLISVTLEAHEYRHIAAGNAGSAILEATSHNPDIMLLDLGLPDMDGVEVIRKIRSWSNMPIIVISARNDDTDKIEALDAGADDYLTKPFSVDELLARLRVTLRRLNQAKADSPDSPVLWGATWENNVASLRVFMATLRKKLEASPDTSMLIQTHVGIGYRMVRIIDN